MSVADHLIRFGALWLAIYGVTFVLYFGFALVFTQIARRHPGRRIQQHRRGEKRKWLEVRQSASSLVVTCGCLAGGLYLQHVGWSLFAPLPLTWWSVPLSFVVSVIVFDGWFYWAHRLNHWGPFYKHHLLHHRAVAPTVWTNYADSWVDAFTQQSYFLFAPLLLPIPPVVLIAHRFYDHFNGMIGHSGFEFFASKSSRFPSPMVCTTFHDQHHSGFNYNFANHFSWWDRLMGTLHPRYDEAVQMMEQTGSPKGPDPKPAGFRSQRTG